MHANKQFVYWPAYCYNKVSYLASYFSNVHLAVDAKTLPLLARVDSALASSRLLCRSSSFV